MSRKPTHNTSEKNYCQVDTIKGFSHIFQMILHEIIKALFNFKSYGLNKKTETIDYDDLAKKAREHKPKLIVKTLLITFCCLHILILYAVIFVNWINTCKEGNRHASKTR